MGKKYKIIFDRSICIGAAACATAAPDFWHIDKDDGKANLIGGKKVAHEKFELIIDEKDFKKNWIASETCPVAGCIKVVELEE